VGSLEAYLDHACAGLRLNPAKAEDIRRELRVHLEERIQDAIAQGLSRADAIARVLARFGEPERIRASLREAHLGEPWWAYRLKAAAFGAFVGALIALLLPLAARLGLDAVLLGVSAGHGARSPLVTLGLVVGGATGLLSGRNRGLLVGPGVGALVWTIESFRVFVSTMGQALSSEASLQVFNSTVLSPIIGALFGVAVGIALTALLSLSPRPRPGPR
jgi:uncharacterized protein YoaH (UPF0181 family)